MKRLAILAACLALGACATNPLIPPSATVAVAQAGTTVDALYNATATIYIDQLPTMSASTKAIAKPLLEQAYVYVQGADKAQALGDATTFAAQVADAEALIAQVKTALGAK